MLAWKWNYSAFVAIERWNVTGKLLKMEWKVVRDAQRGGSRHLGLHTIIIGIIIIVTFRLSRRIDGPKSDVTVCVMELSIFILPHYISLTFSFQS